MAYPTERVIGYVQSAGVLRGSMVYVTTERIIVNRSKGQLSLKFHLFTALLVAFVPFVSAQVTVAILLGVVAIIAGELVRKRRSPEKMALGERRRGGGSAV